MDKVYKRPAVRRDLVNHYAWLVENAGEAVADRFLSQAEAAFDDLLGQPLMGSPLALSRPELAGLRKWRVRDFDNFLIFYLPRSNGILILRVLHAAQDWQNLLGLND